MVYERRGFDVQRVQNPRPADRKSTRLNSSHITISYAVFCLKKKKKKKKEKTRNTKNKKQKQETQRHRTHSPTSKTHPRQNDRPAPCAPPHKDGTYATQVQEA